MVVDGKGADLAHGLFNALLLDFLLDIHSDWIPGIVIGKGIGHGNHDVDRIQAVFIAIHGVTGQPVVAGKLAGRVPADAQKLVIDGVFGLNLQAAAHIEDVLFGDGEFMGKPKGGFFHDIVKQLGDLGIRDGILYCGISLQISGISAGGVGRVDGIELQILQEKDIVFELHPFHVRKVVI